MGLTSVLVVEEQDESLDELAASFSYGDRSDLSFKFLTRFTGSAVGDAVAALFREVGSLLDTGDPARLIDEFIALQSAAYRSRDVNDRYRHEDGPFTIPQVGLADAKVALVTSSGHFVDDPNPMGVEGMDQEEAEARISEFMRTEPVLSEVAVNRSSGEIRVRHGGYDVRGAVADHNVAFPVDPLRRLEQRGVFAALHDVAYSFVGACSQKRLLAGTAAAWAEELVATGSDVVLLVPV